MLKDLHSASCIPGVTTRDCKPFQVKSFLQTHNHPPPRTMATAVKVRCPRYHRCQNISCHHRPSLDAKIGFQTPSTPHNCGGGIADPEISLPCSWLVGRRSFHLVCPHTTLSYCAEFRVSRSPLTTAKPDVIFIEESRSPRDLER